MNRRRYLTAVGSCGVAAVAGCTGLFETESQVVGAPPVVEDRPDAVYVPSHVEGMEMVGTASSGRLRIALSYSLPHRFWLVNGDRTNRVEIEDDDSAHVMISVWDAQTETAIPTSNASATLTKGGETVVDKSLWPMLSQNMGFHYGDNMVLDGDGTYEVEVEFGPVSTPRTGGFQGAFGEQATPSFSLEFEGSTLEDIRFRLLEDRQGERGALDPMEMEMMPVPQLPEPDALPGTVVGEGESGDGVFPVIVADSPPAGVEGSGQYLAVSPRTPYNRFPLPFMSLDATVSRDGETVFAEALSETLDPEYGHHYGAVVDSVEPGDAITVTPRTPPQVSRHEGYETAFVDMSPIELTVE